MLLYVFRMGKIDRERERETRTQSSHPQNKSRCIYVNRILNCSNRFPGFFIYSGHCWEQFVLLCLAFYLSYCPLSSLYRLCHIFWHVCLFFFYSSILFYSKYFFFIVFFSPKNMKIFKDAASIGYTKLFPSSTTSHYQKQTRKTKESGNSNHCLSNIFSFII